MNSCLYYCDLIHDRREPKKHRFAYKTMLFSIDLDESDLLQRSLKLLSVNKRNVYALNDDDHAREGATSLKQNVIRYLRKQGISDEIGRVTLLTNLRAWGYIFNPVSFYIVEDAQGNPLLGVAEVANTFNEMKLYPVRNLTKKGTVFHEEHAKNFYISPYSPLDTQISFRIAQPDEKLALSVTEKKDGRFFFASSLRGKRVELNNRTLALSCIQFPLLTLTVITRIHLQALKLWLKRVPFFRKADNPHLQTETRIYLESEKDQSATIH